MKDMLKASSPSQNLFFSLLLCSISLFLLNYTSVRDGVRRSLMPQLRGDNVVKIEAIDSSEENHTNDNVARRPVMHTFFEPVKGGCCGMTEQGHDNLVKAWTDAWQKHGWETRVLTEADARSHAYFDLFQNLLIDAKINEYDRRCFWRWLAMANQENGGWMSDYDNFPLALTAELGLELEKGPGFKTWNNHVPSLLHADKKSWNRIVGHMMNVIRPDLQVKLISDMQVFLYLHEHMSEEAMGVTTWKNNVLSGFPYVSGGDGKEPLINCEVASQHLTAHLSHHDSREAMETLHIYPKVEGMVSGEHAEKRAEAATIMMRDYHNQCHQQSSVTLFVH